MADPPPEIAGSLILPQVRDGCQSDFLRAINQLAELSDIVFSQGDAGIHFELMARPSKDVARVQLTLDEQNPDYFNQMESWQSFTGRGIATIRAYR